MAITSLDVLLDSMANRAQLAIWNKSTIINMVTGQFISMWRATGTPGQGAIPAAAAVPIRTTTGAITYTNPTGGRSMYIGRGFVISSIAGTDVQFHDRLAHMGGLSGTSIASQTISVDASVVALDARRGDANYSDVQWWLEWYTDTGATASNATVAVTYDDNTTGNLAVIAVGGTIRAGRMIPLLPATAGKRIKSIQTIILSASTGTLGSFGVTATRALGSITCPVANYGTVADWAMIGLPKVADDACIQAVVIAGSTSSGTLYGTTKLIEG